MSSLLSHLENIESGLEYQLNEVRKAKKQLMAKEQVSTRPASRKKTSVTVEVTNKKLKQFQK